MKKFFKFGCLGVIGFFVLGGLISYILNPDDYGSKNEPVEKEIVEIKSWSEMGSSEKEEAIKGFIFSSSEVYSNNRFRLRLAVVETLEKTIKYKETLEFQSMFDNKEWVAADSPSANITEKETMLVLNVDEGRLNVKVPFRSENKLGMKVRNTLSMIVLFEGKSFKIISANIL